MDAGIVAEIHQKIGQYVEHQSSYTNQRCPYRNWPLLYKPWMESCKHSCAGLLMMKAWISSGEDASKLVEEGLQSL